MFAYPMRYWRCVFLAELGRHPCRSDPLHKLLQRSWLCGSVRICPFDESVREDARLGEDVRSSNRDLRIAPILTSAASGDNPWRNVGSAAASIRSVRCSKTRPFKALAFFRFL
jgi:hypothetical protein